jgi:hypothetical protein
MAMSLADAIDAALALKLSLAAEVARSKDVRRVLKHIDAEALLGQATQREAFNQRSSWLSSELARGLAAWAAAEGLPDVTLAQVKQRAPFEGEQLEGVFAELRALAASLAELDAFNKLLAERALGFVRAYVTHLAPHPSAYTRRGMPAAVEAATHSERA